MSDGRALTQFALLDAARSPEIYAALQRFAPDAQCLFGNDISAHLRQVSPHLAQLPAGGPLLSWWREHGLGKSWGIACSSKADQAALRLHFKKFLRVRLPGGDLVLFRFWDPRVMTAFLSGCELYERQAFFGPIEAYYAEETGTGRPLTFRHDQESRA